MASAVLINKITDPRISIFRSLKGKVLRDKGIFIAEGDKAARALLSSNLKIVSAFLTKKWLGKLRRQLDKRGVDIYLAVQKDMEEIVGFKLHQGLMIAARAPKRLSIKNAFRARRLPFLVLAIDGIKDPENVGLIVRNAVAFGSDAIIVGSNSCDPYLRRAVRVSVGAVFDIPVFYADNLCADLKWLKQEKGAKIIAASCAGASRIFNKTDFSGNVCLVFGGEDYGLSAGIIKLADAIVRIPISAGLDSLNVACANAILLQRAAEERGRP